MKRSKGKKTENAKTDNSPHHISTSEDVNGSVRKESEREKNREMERRAREKIVLWRSPVTTLQYFVLEASTLLGILCTR